MAVAADVAAAVVEEEEEDVDAAAAVQGKTHNECD